MKRLGLSPSCEEEKNAKIDSYNDKVKRAEASILREEKKIKDMNKEIRNAYDLCKDYNIE